MYFWIANYSILPPKYFQFKEYNKIAPTAVGAI